MKRWIVGCLFILTITIGPAMAGKGQTKEELQVFMRAKLKHSQNVLEGLVTGDFDKINKGAGDEPA